MVRFHRKSTFSRVHSESRRKKLIIMVHFSEPSEPDLNPGYAHDYDPDVHHDLFCERDDDCCRRGLGDRTALGSVWR